MGKNIFPVREIKNDIRSLVLQKKVWAIAEVAREWQLTVRVTGAADSATGSADGNVSLSQARAEYISRMLQERGVPGEKIQTVAEGGIERFSPPAVNRQCGVELLIE